MISTITSKGQITLPASIRKDLRLKKGDKLDLIITEDGELKGKVVSNSLSTLANTLSKPKKKLTLEEMDQVIRSRKL